MARSVSGLKDVIGIAAEDVSRLWLLVLASMACLGLSQFAVSQEMEIAAIVSGATLFCLALAVRFAVGLFRRAEQRQAEQFGLLVRHDAAPCVVADAIGQIRYQNDAAQAKFGERGGTTLVASLGDHFASPSAVLYRLQSRAEHQGAAREDVVTRRGHTRLSVHQLSDERYLWRLEEFLDRAGAGRGAETLSLPMLTGTCQRL